jgi:hypothetical protein
MRGTMARVYGAAASRQEHDAMQARRSDCNGLNGLGLGTGLKLGDDVTGVWLHATPEIQQVPWFCRHCQIRQSSWGPGGPVAGITMAVPVMDRVGIDRIHPHVQQAGDVCFEAAMLGCGGRCHLDFSNKWGSQFLATAIIYKKVELADLC